MPQAVAALSQQRRVHRGVFRVGINDVGASSSAHCALRSFSSFGQVLCQVFAASQLGALRLSRPAGSANICHVPALKCDDRPARHRACRMRGVKSADLAFVQTKLHCAVPKAHDTSSSRSFAPRSHSGIGQDWHAAGVRTRCVDPAGL